MKRLALAAVAIVMFSGTAFAMPILSPAPCVPKFTGTNGGAVGAPAVTADTIRIGYYIAKADPQAEMIISLGCPNCGKHWELIFDVAHFFWNEIAAQSQRLVYEIDALERAYGWTEREILSLPTERRRTYLEMLAA